MKSILFVLALVLAASLPARASAPMTGSGAPTVFIQSVGDWQLQWISVDNGGNDLYLFAPAGSQVGLSSVTLNAAALTAGGSTTGTVTLSGAAPAGGVTVTLSSDHTNVATVPASVTIAEGASTAQFTVTGAAVTATASATITASYGGTSQTVTLSVSPLPPAAPSNLKVGAVTQSQVTLSWTDNGSNETGFELWRRSGSDPDSRVASPPANSTSFTDASLVPNTAYVYHVRSIGAGGASAFSNEVSATTQPLLPTVTLNPTSVIGGHGAQGTVTLNGPAPASGAPVTLTSDPPGVVTVPGTVTVPAGQTTATFAVTTPAVKSATPVTILASYLNQTQPGAILTVQPPALSALTFDRTSVVGGASVNATLSISDPAPTGGLTLSLGRDNTSAAVTSPASITIPAGQTSAAFAIATQSVATALTVNFTVAFSGASKSQSLTVQPPAPPAAPTNLTVTGATQSTLTLSWTPGSNDATQFKIQRNNGSGFVQIDSVPAGTTSYLSQGLSTDTSYSYRVLASNLGGDSAPAGPVSGKTLAYLITKVTVTPGSVVGGSNATGTVTLNATAPLGGLTVSLLSSSGSATVPGSVTVAAGQTSADFTIGTQAVGQTTAVTLTGTLGTATQTAPLTVLPPTLTWFAIDAASVIGGATVKGSIALSSAAPAGGLAISLTRDNTNAAVSAPTSVTVAAGQTTAQFNITTQTVTSVVAVIFTASFGGVSKPQSLTVQPPTPPAAPSSLTASVVGQGQLALSWKDNSTDETGFEIERKSVSDSAFTRIRSVAAGTTAYTDTGLNASTLYSFRVRAMKGTVPSDYSNVAQATTPVPPVRLTQITLASSSVKGGGSVTGTVTLSGAAPAGGASITFSASGDAAAVTAPVVVAAGQTTVDFTVATHAVAQSTPVTLSGSYGTDTLTVTLTVQPPAPPAAPTNLTVTGATQSTLTLSWTPGSNDATQFKIQRNNGSGFVQIDSVPAGTTSYLSQGLSTDTSYSYRVLASNLGGDSAPAGPVSGKTLAYLITKVTVTPGSVVGGSNATGTVTLNATAPLGGLTVSLLSSSGSATVPGSVTVAAGQTSADFTIGTQAVGQTTAVTLTGTLGTATQTTLTVLPPALTSLALDQANVIGGATVKGTITLSSAAPAGGLAISLTRDNTSSPAVNAPASVTVAAGQTTAQFNITTQSVTTAVTVTFTASFGGVTKPQSLTVQPAANLVPPTNLTVNGATQSSLTLNWTPGNNDASQFKIERNSGSGFTPIGSPVTGTSYVDTGLSANTRYSYRVRATSAGLDSAPSSEASGRTALFLVASVSVAPTSILGGTAVQGTVTLNAAAPTGGVAVTITSDQTSVASVPQTVTVPQGQSAVQFNITTAAVPGATAVTVAAQAAGDPGQSATLTVLPPALASFALDPTSVTGAATVKGTITLSGPAPTGGLAISLTRDNTSSPAVNAPASVTVATGQTTAQFNITTQDVTAALTVTFTASFGGVTKPQSLTVQPSAPVAPTNLTVTAATQSSLTLSWTPGNSDSVSFKIERKSGSGFIVIDTVQGVTSYVDRGLTANTGYTYQVRATKAGVDSTPSNAFTASTLAQTVHGIGIFRPSKNDWFLRGDDGSVKQVHFGGAGDIPMAADYLGTGSAQVAVFRPMTREWFIHSDKGDQRYQWGGPDDIPVPADYLGLHHAQIAVFRTTTKEWFIRRDDGTPQTFQWGGDGDVPLPADYLGLGHAQVAIFRVPTKEWFIMGDHGEVIHYQWGGDGDIPVPADYLGLGHAQVAVFRVPTNEWFIMGDHGAVSHYQWGGAGDIPVPADYLGQSHAQIAVFRPLTKEWFIMGPQGQPVYVQWGGLDDLPVPDGLNPRNGRTSLDLP